MALIAVRPWRVTTHQRSLWRLFSTAHSHNGAPASHGEYNEEAILEGVQKYANLPLAYTNFPAEHIDFAVFERSWSPPRPTVVYKGKFKMGGLLHVTPWAVAAYAAVGTKGSQSLPWSFEENINWTSQVVALSFKPRHSNEQVNEEMLGYHDWLRIIQAKFVAHLACHLDVYTELRSKIPEGVKAVDWLAENIYGRLPGDLLSPVDTEADDVPVVELKCKLFKKPKIPPTKFACEYDQEVFIKSHIVRNNIPVYDSAGQPIPVMATRACSGDVLSCTVSLFPWVMEAKCGVSRLLKGVSILAKQHPASDSDEFIEDYVHEGTLPKALQYDKRLWNGGAPF